MESGTLNNARAVNMPNVSVQSRTIEPAKINKSIDKKGGSRHETDGYIIGGSMYVNVNPCLYKGGIC